MLESGLDVPLNTYLKIVSPLWGIMLTPKRWSPRSPPPNSLWPALSAAPFSKGRWEGSESGFKPPPPQLDFSSTVACRYEGLQYRG